MGTPTFPGKFGIAYRLVDGNGSNPFLGDRGDDAERWDEVVDWATGNRGIAHVEWIFRNGQTFGAYLDGSKWDTVWNRGIYSPEGILNAKLWRVEWLDVTPREESIIREACNRLTGRPYDFAGALRVGKRGIKLIPQDDYRYFCSEILVETGQDARLFPGVPACEMDPADVAEYQPKSARGDRDPLAWKMSQTKRLNQAWADA